MNYLFINETKEIRINESYIWKEWTTHEPNYKNHFGKWTPNQLRNLIYLWKKLARKIKQTK